jgi:ABC-type molybdate transport system substrate-binding protein
MKIEQTYKLAGCALARLFKNDGASPALLLLSLCSISLLSLVGCSKKEAKEKKNELVMLCGDSFLPPAKQLCSEFKAKTGIEILSTVAGSENLLPHVKARDEGDIFIPTIPIWITPATPTRWRIT